MSKLQDFEVDQLSSLSFKEIIDRVAEGEVFQNIFGFSDDEMQEFYKISMQYFNDKQFEEASDCFLFLTALNPSESNLWIKYGNTEHALGHFQDALLAYSQAMFWDSIDPFPHFYAAEAYQRLGDLHHAKECIYICLRLIDEHAEYAPLRQLAYKLQESITKR